VAVISVTEEAQFANLIRLSEADFLDLFSNLDEDDRIQWFEGLSDQQQFEVIERLGQEMADFLFNYHPDEPDDRCWKKEKIKWFWFCHRREGKIACLHAFKHQKRLFRNQWKERCHRKRWKRFLNERPISGRKNK